MNKIKCLICITLAFLMGLICVSCNLEDFAPEKYGEWDGLYIYRGNAKAKTTGEDFQPLVETLVINEEQHRVIACNDYFTVDSDIYMLLICQDADNPIPQYTDDLSNKVEFVHCLVKYNIENKTQEVLFVEQKIACERQEYFYRPVLIEEVFDNRIIMEARVCLAENFIDDCIVNYKFISIDFSGELISAEESYSSKWERVSKEYLIKVDFNSQTSKVELYYRTNDFSEPVLFLELEEDCGFEWNYVKQNDVEGVLIQYYKYVEGTSILEKLAFYNLKTKTMSEPINVFKKAQLYGDGNFIKTYNRNKRVQYKLSVSDTYKHSDLVETDNMLYRIVYDQNGISLQEMLDLKEDREVKIYAVLQDKVVFREIEYIDAVGCSSGGGKSTYYEYNVDTGVKTKIGNNKAMALKEDYEVYYKKQGGVQCGNYTYFLHDHELSGGLWGNLTSFVYTLKRINNQTNQVEAMQYFHESSSYKDDEGIQNYCEELWRNQGGSFYDFILMED